MNPEIPADFTYLAKSPAAAARTLGDEAIIMSTETSTLFSLNPTGAFLWEAADGKTPLPALVEKLCAEYDVTPQQATADALEFAQSMTQHGILLASAEPLNV